MKPSPFIYHAPASVADVVALLATHGDEAKPLAGGQSLIPLLSLRLTRYGHLIDLGRVPDLIAMSNNGHEVAVGAMVRQADAEHDETIGLLNPLLARALPFVGHFQIRNCGTIGGSLAHADPASELPAVALALGASFDLVGPSGERTVSSDNFFVDRWTTALESDEILVRTRFPVWKGRCGFAIQEVARRHGDFAMVGVASAVALDSAARVVIVRITMFGVGSTPQRVLAAETALTGISAAELSEQDLRDLGHLATVDLDPPDDVHATGAYRRSAGAIIVAHALGAALKEALRA